MSLKCLIGTLLRSRNTRRSRSEPETEAASGRVETATDSYVGCLVGQGRRTRARSPKKVRGWLARVSAARSACSNLGIRDLHGGGARTLVVVRIRVRGGRGDRGTGVAGAVAVGDKDGGGLDVVSGQCGIERRFVPGAGGKLSSAARAASSRIVAHLASFEFPSLSVVGSWVALSWISLVTRTASAWRHVRAPPF